MTQQQRTPTATVYLALENIIRAGDVKQIIVNTQAELDSVDAKFSGEIIITGGTWDDPITVHASGSASVYARNSATVHARDSATVHARDSATVYAWDSATVYAWDSATVHAWDSATVDLFAFAVAMLFGVARATRKSKTATIIRPKQGRTVKDEYGLVGAGGGCRP